MNTFNHFNTTDHPSPNPRHFNLIRATAAAALVIILIFLTAGSGYAADGTWSGATSGAWLNAGNWDTVPGSSSDTGNTDWALFGVTNNATVGINMNTTAGNYYLGAIDYTNATARNIGNSSSTTPGVLTLNGTTLNSVANTIIWHRTTTTLTIQASQSGGGTMGLALGNATDNIIQITGSANVAISSSISGASKKLTLQGGGTGILSLT
ncbi:MAG: hypothetical protein MUF81_18605, partial [Verrucomicrobia bacterium]|nr:hypothetical protein [Verrucomicrobiota bacterium]